MNDDGPTQAVNDQPGYWAVVPAAGVGQRMRSVAHQVPKQYLKIRGHSILELTLNRLNQLQQLSGIVLVLNVEDNWFRKLDISCGEKLLTATGGAERAISVFNGLQALEDKAADDDWVLVHDVVRPCVSIEDMQRLVDELRNEVSGGLLVIPVTETLKQVGDDNTVTCTVPRENYRLAGTPQMFRYRQLFNALDKALTDKVNVTDEAHAMEYAGHTINTIQGGADNIKITHAEDLVLAEFILNRQGAI